MTATTAAPPRIVTLDIVRGVAVMGILAMNIVAFAMPFQAYMNPAAYGSHSVADYASWAFNFILIDGKMRGLFSFLFGASMLLVIERAVAAGRSPAKVHYLRMIWLLVFGLIHFYFIWFGDILAGYAQVGMIAYLFHKLSAKTLIRIGIGLLVIQTLLMAAGAAQAFYLSTVVGTPAMSPDDLASWNQFRDAFGTPTAQELSTNLARMGGDYGPILHERLTEHTWDPFQGLIFFGAETLAYFLFGMALLKNGFFRGAWEPARYKRTMLICFGIAIPVYAVLAVLLFRDGYSIPMVFACVLAATTPFRPLMVVGIACLIILLTRRGGALVERIAAAGRAAFTNYLGTSLFMTFLFYGYGFDYFGQLTRIQLWIPVLAAWALMLIWSKPWLDTHLYGPFEWLWRSLARGRLQPMRKREAAASEALAEA